LTAPEEYTFCVFVLPTGVYHGTHPVKALILDDFDRTAPKGTGNAKVGGNYAPVLRWSDGASKQGFGITLHLDSARHEEIDEFSTSGFIGVKRKSDDDITMVVPDSNCVIDSVTSDSIQEIARSYGWKVEKRVIKYAELPEFTEVMAAGTAAALVPIRSITRRASKGLPAGEKVTTTDEAEVVTYLPESQEEPGEFCVKLLGHLKGIQVGKEKDQFGWRFGVEEKDGGVEGAKGKANGDATPPVDQME
jgi:branched-chain amino acid aminotransferase